MITLDEAKLHLRIETDETEEHALISALIEGAYLHAEKRTGVQFKQQSKKLVLDTFPAVAKAIELPWTPVSEIDALSYMDSDGVAQELDPQTLRLDSRSIYPILAPQYGTEWPKTTDKPQCVTITATVGSTETPADVRAALLLIIGHLYANRESVIIGTSTETLPMGVEMLLAPYVIHSVG